MHANQHIAMLLSFVLLCIGTLPIQAEEDDLKNLKKLYSRPINIPYPSSNPYSFKKEQLGKILFFDPRLSASGTQSCATCHNPALNWEDGMALGTGDQHKKLGRSTPTILNLAWDEFYFWDGRADSLEAQASMPIESAAEMNMTEGKLITFLKSISEYGVLFADAFPENIDPINKTNLSKAIATYERGIISGTAPFDRWIEGDRDAISDEAKQGFILFNKKANCAACHSGWNFSDSSFHDIGLTSPDRGRGKFIPHIAPMQHAFKTTGLRNIAQRAPYMHDGSLETLDEVLDHYNNGFIKRKSLSDEIKPLHLSSKEKNALIAFLETLTSKDKPVVIPVLPKGKKHNKGS